MLGLGRPCLFLVIAWLALTSPAFGHLARCSFDPACICITWSFEDSSTIEIRCPSSQGQGSGWANPGSTTSEPPEIEDENGSFHGSGHFDGPPFLMGSEPNFAQSTKLTRGKSLALSKLSTLDTCRALFANSPLTENPIWLLSKIQWRNGQDYGQSKCSEPDQVAFHVGESHSIQVLLCEAFSDLNTSQAAVIVIHEALHVAGQRENGDGAAGPNNPPGSLSISRAVADACELLW